MFLWNIDLILVMNKDHNRSQQTRVQTTEKVYRDLSWFFLKIKLSNPQQDSREKGIKKEITDCLDGEQPKRYKYRW